MLLKLNSRAIDDVIVIDMAGRITCGDPQILLREAFHRFIDDGSLRFVMNLSEVSFVDSSGLAELVSIKILLDRRGGHVNLLGLTKKVKDLLVMTRLLVEFESFEEESKAVAALQGVRRTKASQKV